MQKYISLIKVSLNHDMNIFKISKKKETIYTKYLFPLLFTLYLMFLVGSYTNKLITILKPMHIEYVVISIFSLGITIMTFMEGIYKSSSLLFNCKDDNLLFSLPIKKSTILFIRMLKFYIFELLYNSLFLIPVIIVYAINIHPSLNFYLSSIIALLLLPIVPIILSCICGFITTELSSKFKGKNFIQTIFTIIILLGVLYISYNLEGFINDIASKANSINEVITKIYYPVGAYISLITDFNIKTLIVFILGHVIISILTIIILGKLYYKINSSNKKVITSKRNKEYKIVTNKKSISFIKKELNRFLATPVFIINSGFGLVLHIVACIGICLKYDNIIESLIKVNPFLDKSTINGYIPIITFSLIVFSSLMTSITSSMISLEGKSISILKSLPIKVIEIVIYKVITALIIMIPCILLGNIILFIKFKYSILSITLLLISTILLPLVSELIGITINLRYPKLDANNDTEVVKQSMSSMLSVFVGMILIGLTVLSIFKLYDLGWNSNNIIILILIVYIIICICLLKLVNSTCEDSFNKMNI